MPATRALIKLGSRRIPGYLDIVLSHNNNKKYTVLPINAKPCHQSVNIAKLASSIIRGASQLAGIAGAMILSYACWTCLVDVWDRTRCHVTVDIALLSPATRSSLQLPPYMLTHRNKNFFALGKRLAHASFLKSGRVWEIVPGSHDVYRGHWLPWTTWCSYTQNIVPYEQSD